MMNLTRLTFLLFLIGGISAHAAPAKPRGSIIEDRAARKLVEAGDARLDANETEKALEIWKSVIERYPRSKVRFEAHLRIGNFLLAKNRAYDKARTHFESASSEENADNEMRAKAKLKVGACFFESRLYAKCFKTMRDVIEEFPVSSEVNEAYYYIGLGHFKMGHYSRAIDALGKVGTALSAGDQSVEKVEAGKRLFVKIDDTDLAILEEGETVPVECKTVSGDREVAECLPVGQNMRVVLGSLPTALGRPKPDNGILEVRGNDVVKVNYLDEHTADRTFNKPRLKDILVVGNAKVQVTDGAFKEALKGVVLGKPVHIQITDADFDVSDGEDSLKAKVGIYRPKTPAEIEEELAALIAKGEVSVENGEQPKIEPFKKMEERAITLKEMKPVREEPAEAAKPDEPTEDAKPELAQPEIDKTESKPDTSEFLKEITEPKAEVDDSIHTGVFQTTVPLINSETANSWEKGMKALPADVLRVTFVDDRNMSPGSKTVRTDARCIEGNLGGVRVTRAEITDEELRIQTKLKTADALTSIGNQYKEFGLDDKAKLKYAEALRVCDEIMKDARLMGGRILEETYVQLWRIYFAMDNLKLATAMSRRLQREFPNSAFVDEAMLQEALVAQKKGELGRAISLFGAIRKLNKSTLRGEGQFGIAECYEKMATLEEGQKSNMLFERAFQEYKRVFEQYPESARVGDAVAKMANFYYQKKDYARAVDVFENVLSDYPDAHFLDVILYNYGRCLYRLERKKQARVKFDQLIGDFPESNLAAEAKKISEALLQGGF